MRKLYKSLFSISALTLGAFGVADAQCTYTIDMTDTWGDGWNGNQLEVSINGVATNYTLSSGASGTQTFNVNDNDIVVITYLGGGSFNSEVGWTVTDNNSNVLTSVFSSPTVGLLYWQGGISCAGTCVMVTNLTDAPDCSLNDQIDLSWTTNGSETSWILEYGANPTALGSGTSMTLTSGDVTIAGSTVSYSLTGLTSSTSYDIYVAADCGSGVPSNYTFGSYSTAADCPDITGLALTALYDNDSVGMTWTAGCVETSWNIEIGALGFTPGTGTSIVATTSSVESDTVGGLTQLTDYDVYVQADCGGTTANWVGPLAYTTAANCPDVSGITVDTQVGDSLFISWTSNGSESMWDVEYGPAGFITGSGTMMSSTATNDTIVGVMSGMTYDIYVRSDCGGVDQGTWIGPISYTSACTALMPVTLPFVEDFESWTLTQVGDSLIYCGADKSWNFTTDYQAYGRVRIGSDAVTALNGNGSMTLDVTTDGFDAISYADLTLDLSAYASSTTLHFSCNWMEHGDELDTDDKVWVRGSDQDPWLQVLDWNTNNGDGILTQLIEFDISTLLAANSQAPSSTFGVRFGWSDNYAATSATGTDGVSFDDIRIEEVTCKMPTNLSNVYGNADTVVIDWTANGAETEWAFEYGLQGFTPGSGTLVSTMNHPDTITGLTAGTLYDFYLAAVCGAGDTSHWYGPVVIVPNVTNDSACNAIMVPVDGSTTDYSNQGASNTGEPGNTMYNSVWFEFVAPTSGHVAIATCGELFDTELSVFDTIADCLDYSSYVEIAYADGNPWGCSGDDPAGVEVCGLIPGETYRFKVGAYSSGTPYTTFPLTLWDLDYDAGTGATVDACAGIDTVNLVPLVTGTYSLFPGYFDYPSNSATLVDDTMAVAANFTLGNNQVYYIVGNDCMMDTAYVTVNVSTESYSGEAVSPFMSCNTDVFLPDGLTGTIDNGGTWSDDSGTGLLAGPNGNVFVAVDAPNGTYPFTYTVSNGVCPASSTTVIVTISDCSGIGETDVFVSMYPNPNSGNFNIISNVSGENNVVITDISGKVIYNNVVGLTAGTPFEITLDNVETGMYMINISNATGSNVMTMIIK
ncbi:MAG: T9SS type A sorting domain-containing protein [Flavobacteriales bacterium]|nr:T9SS type A sorting domain-containing protein [Flavobacteriales bacterium]